MRVRSSSSETSCSWYASMSRAMLARIRPTVLTGLAFHGDGVLARSSASRRSISARTRAGLASKLDDLLPDQRVQGVLPHRTVRAAAALRKAVRSIRRPRSDSRRARAATSASNCGRTRSRRADRPAALAESDGPLVRRAANRRFCANRSCASANWVGRDQRRHRNLDPLLARAIAQFTDGPGRDAARAAAGGG